MALWVVTPRSGRGNTPAVDDRSAEKAAKNETISRSLNDALSKGEQRWPSGTPTFICECSDLSCVNEIFVPLDVYAEVRSHKDRFILRPDHVVEEIERVVQDRTNVVVVEKIGPGKAVATADAS